MVDVGPWPSPLESATAAGLGLGMMAAAGPTYGAARAHCCFPGGRPGGGTSAAAVGACLGRG